jgi:hypothetical protein
VRDATDPETGALNPYAIGPLRRQYAQEILPHLAGIGRIELPAEFRAPSAVAQYGMLYPHSFVALAYQQGFRG